MAIELVGELERPDLAAEKITALALLDFQVGLTLKRLAWLPAEDGDEAVARKVVVVEYHLENVADAVVAQLDGRCARHQRLTPTAAVCAPAAAHPCVDRAQLLEWRGGPGAEGERSAVGSAAELREQRRADSLWRPDGGAGR